MLVNGNILNDRYTLQKKLGDNPLRQTWLAKDNQLKNLVILKLLVFGTPMQWRDLTLFEREAKILKHISHPRIPEFIEYFTFEADCSYFVLVQSYIPGHSLQNLLDRGRRFTALDLESLATQILEILIYLHQLNPPVLHRDIKPSNIIWGEDNSIYLIDFGAVQIETPKTGSSFTVVGTYGYTPIEQFGGKAVPNSDLYALGCTLIHLLTGISPAELPQRSGKIYFRNLTNLDFQFIRWIEWLSEPIAEKRPASAAIALASLKTKNFQDREISKYLPKNIARSIANVLLVKPNQIIFANQFGLKSNKPPKKSNITLDRTGEVANITIPPLGMFFKIKDASEFIALAIVSSWLGPLFLFFLATNPLFSSVLSCGLIFYIYQLLTTINLYLGTKYLSIVYKILGVNYTLLKIPKNSITQLNFIVDRPRKRSLIEIDCGDKQHILNILGRCSIREKAWITLILSNWSNSPIVQENL